MQARVESTWVLCIMLVMAYIVFLMAMLWIVRKDDVGL